jgi:hypothetical protein
VLSSIGAGKIKNETLVLAKFNLVYITALHFTEIYCFHYEMEIEGYFETVGMKQP